MSIIIPTTADIRACLFSILSNNVDVITWATSHDITLTGTRFREWQPFAPLLDLGILIDIDPVAELSPNQSCRSGFYDGRFTMYVQYSGSASTLPSEWLGVLETALDDSSRHIMGPSGQIIYLKDIEFLSRGPQVRREEGFEILTNFRFKARYAV